MKAPGWITLKQDGCLGQTVIMKMHVRRWHPGFWLYVVKRLRSR